MFTRHDSVAPAPAELRTLAGARVVACRNYRDLPGVGYVVTVVAADDLGSGVLTDYPVDCLTIDRPAVVKAVA